MFSQDTFSIICGFLKPTELSRARLLDRTYYTWTTLFLQHVYGTAILEDLICPKCGNWITYEEFDRNDYYDLYQYVYQAEYNKREHLLKKVFKNKPFLRQSLLCEDCDHDEVWDADITFRYRGDRNYTLIVSHDPLYPWAFLYMKKTKLFWNQYKLFIESNWDDDSTPYIEYITSNELIS